MWAEQFSLQQNHESMKYRWGSTCLLNHKLTGVPAQQRHGFWAMEEEDEAVLRALVARAEELECDGEERGRALAMAGV